MIKITAKLTGTDRVLQILKTLASYPKGVSLDELSKQLGYPKSSVHRALQALRNAELVYPLGDGMYILSDNFIGLAFTFAESRPIVARFQPILEELSALTGEASHLAILDGTEIIYRGKATAPGRAIKLTSVVGGRNPAYCTSVGKLLLSYIVDSYKELEEIFSDTPLVPRTTNTITSLKTLWADLQETKQRGFGIENEENEDNVSCLALPVFSTNSAKPSGAISISALTFRTPLSSLLDQLDEIKAIIYRKN